jgi:ornithine cyclodeaminase/alanine dehydrogenase
MRTLILAKADMARVATTEVAVRAVEEAFGAFGRGEAQMPPKVYLSIKEHEGDFRAMPSRMGDLAGIKWVNVHAHNPSRYGLPAVMGVYILNDARNAFPLAVMDGTLLTALRTGAAGAVASKFLVSGPPTSLGLIGCGVQAHTLLASHRVVFEELEVLAADRDEERAKAFAREVGGRAVSLEEAAGADIVCTATPSRTPFLRAAWVRQGAHINAMGADAPGKQELEPELLERGAVYIDDPHQAEGSGEINVPIRTGRFSLDRVAGTLGEVVAGKTPRPAAGTTTIFDSTGLAIQDLGLARAIYEAAKDEGLGIEVDLAGLDEEPAQT